MSDMIPARPSFTDGQYIDAADLNAAVTFARDETRRLALSGQSWGIATGLALVEVTDSTGSVQLFIERVLRNLETQTNPTDIDGALWTWMKRYRVWQANREVFLWPENWLYPELRDDQSPIFQQMMASVLLIAVYAGELSRRPVPFAVAASLN